MKIYWPIRYLDRTDRQFKDRRLILDTVTLDAVTKAAIELVTESGKHSSERAILKFRHLFQEGELEFDGFNLPQSVFLMDYVEDEQGKEISLTEVGRILSGNPDVVYVPNEFERHDVELMFSEPKPIPVDNVSLSPANQRLLGYFCRDFHEFSESAFMKDGPGSIKATGATEPVLQTAVSHEEISAFVTIFRRLYMKDEPANFEKAADAYSDALGDHPYERWIKGCKDSYVAALACTPDMCPFVAQGTLTFTVKRLIDVFLYTQYAHQPDERRQRQYGDCLNEVSGFKDVLAWLFLTEIWKVSLKIKCAGKVIAGWFKRYCEHHQVVPDVVDSVTHNHAGIGATEKESNRRARLFRQKTEELATQIWTDNGQPVGGPSQFFAEAEKQLQAMTA